MKKCTSWLKPFLIFYVGINLLAGIASFALAITGMDPAFFLSGAAVVIVLCYVLLHKKLTPSAIWMNGIITLVMTGLFSLGMVIYDGSCTGLIFTILEYLEFPFIGLLVILSLTSSITDFYVCALIFLLLETVLAFVLQYNKLKAGAQHLKKCTKAGVAFLLILALLGSVDGYFYANRPEKRYSGHGFHYMNGYSSTDFTDYTVYCDESKSKLVKLDHTPELQITDKSQMPVMDGAEACYPVYAAIADACYVGISEIEKNFVENKDENEKNSLYNGEIVSFTNTINGFYRLLDKEVDLLFSAKPSKDQLAMAKEEHVNLEVTPIGKEAFVFFVEEDNPIDNLTSEQIRSIYHGDITNWSELGGPDQEIIAFQRPANSGSQTMMEYFMGDITLKEPRTYETIDSMVGIISNVAQYANEEGAMGYSFRYFIEGLNQEKNVKIISIDGVKPTIETIEDGSYPLVTSLCLITRQNDPNPNVQKMIDFCLSEDGQEIIRKTGYGGL